jgi:methionyl-tRNA synthetase
MVKNNLKVTRKFYVTSTIPYSNAPGHIGHALEFVQADVLARWNRIKGKDVFFLTGTDEHGVKNYQTAKKEGLDTKKFVDRNAGFFKDLMKLLNISNDYFIRTTDKKVHWPGVLEMWNKLEKKGDIYKKKYTGSYCSGCERFVTEKDLVDGKCPDHPTKKIEIISEENYFFKLSKYSDEIKKRIDSGKFEIYPKKWRNSFLAFMKDGLQDVSFSREKKHLPWGVPVPNDDSQVMYVWCDALTNYLTGIGYPDKKYKKYWPADVHVVGKDMLRFHAGIWPGMLLGAGIPLPEKLIVHGFLTIDGKKMSKSTGNVIDPAELAKKYGADAVRYYLLRSVPFGDDGDISEIAIVDRFNNELANKLGNLVSRVGGLIEKNGVEKCPNKLIKKLNEKKIDKLMEGYEFDKALNEIFGFIDICNEYVQAKKPWETKDGKVLFELKEAILKIADLLSPFIPESAEKIKKTFSAKKIVKGEVLFRKVEFEKEKVNKNEKLEGVMTMKEAVFEDWEKLDLRVAKIKNVEDIEGADKLFKLTLDVGELGERTICAGIKEFYKKTELKGKTIIYFSNLKPRKMRGIESQGMLLAASTGDHKKVVLISPEKDIELGSIVG